MKHLRQLGLIIIVFALCLPILAQEQGFENQYDFGNNVFISYPDGWDVFIDEETDDNYIYSEKTDILILFEAYDAEQSLMDYLSNLYERTQQDSSLSLDEESVVIDQLGNLSEIASYTYDDNADGDVFQRYIFAIPLEDEIVVLVSVAPYADRKIDEIATVLDILATLQYGADDASATEESPEQATPIPTPTPDPTIPRSITWDNQLSVQIPGDWESDTSEDGYNYVASDAVTIVFFTKMIEDERQDTRANFLREIYHNTDFLINLTIPFDEDLFFFVDLTNDPLALGYQYEEAFEGDTYEQLLVAVQSSSTMLVVAVAYPRDSDTFTEAILEDIYSTLDTLRSP